MSARHVAQVSVSRLLEPLDSERLAGFVAALDPVNGRAEEHTALWWVPAGTVPTVSEAAARLEHLRSHGPTAHAFTFGHSFPPPAG